MDETWNLWDIKSEAIEKIETCGTDVELRACLISYQDRIIKKALSIENTRELYTGELAILSESTSWMGLYFNIDGSLK